MVACVLIPRFELAVAAGGLEALAGRAVAIAPDGGPGPIGEVSGAAQAFGVRSGMAHSGPMISIPAAAAWRAAVVISTGRPLSSIRLLIPPIRASLGPASWRTGGPQFIALDADANVCHTHR